MDKKLLVLNTNLDKIVSRINIYNKSDEIVTMRKQRIDAQNKLHNYLRSKERKIYLSKFNNNDIPNNP